MKTKIFLADDERPVLDMLSAAINKFLPDIDICGVALSGPEALDGAGKAHPDVILVDVRMPGMNGLEVIRQLKALSPETVPILLTAYERFDVAKEAFGLGVYDYLLKPVSHDILTAAIRGALAVSSSRQKEALRVSQALSMIETQRPFLEAGFVYAAIAGSDIVQSYAKILGFNQDGGGFLLFSRKLPVFLSKIDVEKIRASLTYRIDCAIGAAHGGLLPVFYPQNEAQNVQNAADMAIKESGLADLFVTISHTESLANIHGAWSQVISQESCNSAEPSLIFEPLLEALEGGSIAEAMAAWLALPKDDTVLKALMAGAAAWACRCNSDIFKEILASLRMGHIPVAAFQQESFYTKFAASARINEALHYIETNYADNISLESAANWVGFSASYLSKQLSSETGKSFIEHLTHIRIEKAKKALASGLVSIKEVGFSVGYSDPNYFSRAFKSETGLSPSEYIKKYKLVQNNEI